MTRATVCGMSCRGTNNIRACAAEIVDTLSEQDFGEMTLDRWIALYAQAKELQKSKEDLSRVRTAPRTPHDIPYTDIEVSLGVPWVGEEIISDFTYFLCTGKEAFAAKGDTPHKLVSYEPLTGYWYVENKQRGYGDRTRIERTYGLPNYNALYILEAALNLREIRRETKEETLAAQEKQEAIEKLKSALTVEQDRYIKQFTTMEQMISQMNSQSSYLSSLSGSM